MAKRIDFNLRTMTPSLDLHRRDWVPEDGAGLAGSWLGAVVSDAAGQDYLGLRGTDDSIPGMTHVATPFCGFRSLARNFDGMPPHLYNEYAVIDGYEPAIGSKPPTRVDESLATRMVCTGTTPVVVGTFTRGPSVTSSSSTCRCRKA